MNNVSWQTSPQQLTLDTLAIHIWRVLLASSSEFSSVILSDEEKRWSEHFMREEHRKRYCLARIFLRKILARYLKIAPAAIVFRQAVYGKPSLANSPIALQFNMTHSQDLALYAVTLNQEIGIDVEWINPDLAVSPLVSRFFTAQEQQFFSLLPSGTTKSRLLPIMDSKRSLTKGNWYRIKWTRADGQSSSQHLDHEFCSCPKLHGRPGGHYPEYIITLYPPLLRT